MRRYAQTALLLLLGGMMLKLAVTGAYARYVGDVYLPLLILAGLGLLTVAAVTLWQDIRTLGRPGDDDATGPLTLGGLFRTVVLSAPERGGATPPVTGEIRPEPTEHTTQSSTVDYRERALAAGLAAAAHEGLDETRSDEAPALAATNAPTAVFDVVPAPVAADDPAFADPPAPVDPFDPAQAATPPPIVAGTRGGWALLLAALAVLVIAPTPLGIYPAGRLGTITATTDAELRNAASDPVALSLVDYVAYASGGGAALAGRQVRLVGFVLAGPRGEPYLARLAVGCCAAGARPVKVGLTGDLPGLLTPGAWIAVTGTYSELVDRDPVNGAPIPYLSVVELTELEPPADPYER